MADRTTTCQDSSMPTSLPGGAADSTQSTEPTLNSYITSLGNVNTSPDRTLHMSEIAPSCSSPEKMVTAPSSPDCAAAILREGPNLCQDGDDSKSKASLTENLSLQNGHTSSKGPPQSASDIATGKDAQALDAPPLQDSATAAAGAWSGGASDRRLYIVEALYKILPQHPKLSDVTQARKADEIKRQKLDIASLSTEEFKPSTPSFHKNPKRHGHLISDPPSRTLYTIEVLMKESTYSRSQPPRNWHIHHKHPEVSSKDRPLPNVPDRVRIRSTFLLNLLSRIVGVKLAYGGGRSSVEERTSLVFVYPFKFFVTFANEIKAEAARLKTKFGRDSQSEQPRTPTRLNDVANDDSALGTMEEDYDSEKAFRYLALVIKLMDEYLKPVFNLRESYRKATHDTIFFPDLWLLFDTGGLLFQREPLPDHPPQISRLIHCNGGRQLLNNSEFKSQDNTRGNIPEANSKGRENQFCLDHYRLDFNGEFYGPRVHCQWFSAWQGERSVYDLEVFPLQFVRNHKDHNSENLNDYQSHLVERGKRFVELGAIDHRFYSGEVIGTHHVHYSSTVVIDFKLQMRNTEPQSGLLGLDDILLKSESDLATGLSIFRGDPREVQEGTLRANNTEECDFPGCDGNDFIHDDVLLDHIVAHQKLVHYGRTSAKFQRNNLGDLTEADYMLFPSYVNGYVLNDRVWARLHLDALKPNSWIGSKFDALQIPPQHKTYLKALVAMCDRRFSNRLSLDVIPGKGQGVIILLHGKPGVGKTATAGAVAAEMKRPLYPINYADLGHEAATAETNLKRIFRYGQRWNCVLLLDEADVFLTERDNQLTKRNSIVSVFLRNLEWYPGLIFMTTNALEKFDAGILDRIHIKLRYPGLSEPYTEKIFNYHFEKINQANRDMQGLSMDKRDSATMRYAVSKENMAAIQQWRKDQHLKARLAGSHDWWNGRQIRVAFQMAAALARQEMLENDGWTAQIKKSHFESIAELNDAFNTDLTNARNEQPDKPDQTEQVQVHPQTT